MNPVFTISNKRMENGLAELFSAGLFLENTLAKILIKSNEISIIIVQRKEVTVCQLQRQN